MGKCIKLIRSRCDISRCNSGIIPDKNQPLPNHGEIMISIHKILQLIVIQLPTFTCSKNISVDGWLVKLYILDGWTYCYRNTKLMIHSNFYNVIVSISYNVTYCIDHLKKILRRILAIFQGASRSSPLSKCIDFGIKWTRYVFEVLLMIDMGSKMTLIVLYPLHMNLFVRIRYQSLHFFGWMEINRDRSRDLEHTFDFAHLDFKHNPMMTES